MRRQTNTQQFNHWPNRRTANEPHANPIAAASPYLLLPIPNPTYRNPHHSLSQPSRDRSHPSSPAAAAPSLLQPHGGSTSIAQDPHGLKLREIGDVASCSSLSYRNRCPFPPLAARQVNSWGRIHVALRSGMSRRGGPHPLVGGGPSSGLPLVEAAVA